MVCEMCHVLGGVVGIIGWLLGGLEYVTKPVEDNCCKMEKQARRKPDRKKHKCTSTYKFKLNFVR